MIKKSFLVAVSCLLASGVWAVEPAVTITASTTDLSAWNTTYNAGTPLEIKLSTASGVATANKKPCGVSVNETVLSLSSSDTHYLTFELPAGSDATIDSILFRLSGNNSGSNDWFSPLFYCPEATFNTANVTGVFDVHFTGYDNPCTDVMAKLQAGSKSCRMYRRAKYTPGTPGTVGSGSNYGSGQTTNIVYVEIYITGGTPVGPVAVTGVKLDKTELTLEAGQEAQLTATVEPDEADNKSVSWSSSADGIASVDATGKVSANSAGVAVITVTTADGGYTATCTVTVTEPAAPVAVTGVTLDKTELTIIEGKSETLTASVQPSDATNKAVSWSSDNTAVATVTNGVVNALTVGTAAITVTTADGGYTATCNVTVEEAPVIHVTGVSLNKTTLSLKEGTSETLTATISPNDAADKSVTWSSNNDGVATVSNGNVTAIAEGTAIITVTTIDGGYTASCEVTVTAGTPVPPTGLKLHSTGVYEAQAKDGGYDTPLVIAEAEGEKREYEVYYTFKGKLSSSIATAATTPGGDYLTDENTKALDGWFEGNPGSMEEKGAGAVDEFAEGTGNWKMKNNESLQMHVVGYDEFAILAEDKDNSNPDKQFHIFLNGEEATPAQHSTSPTVRRVTLNPTQEYLIEVKAYGSSQMKLYGWSLRVAQVPKTQHIKGNDSTQVILQTTAPRPIYYYTKYSKRGETKVIWDGPEATGIDLSVKTEGEIGDTLVFGGNANCPVGDYQYAIVSYYNGKETSRCAGKFSVYSDIRATTDTDVEGYQNEEMDMIAFLYYALSEDDVLLTWSAGKPDGVICKGENGRYTISGTPTTIGVFPFEITVTAADTILKGKLTVKELDYGENPVLYLYRSSEAYLSDGVYQYLKSAGYWNPVERRQKAEGGLRPVEQYSKYNWILISEDADANNEEVLALIRGGVSLPVLNMKAFSYVYQRDEDTPNGWGEADNGSLSNEGRYVTVQRDDHPIFKELKKKQGDKIMVLDTVIRKGLMPIRIFQQGGTLCLATALTRSYEDYYGDGEPQTFLHEIPAANRGGKKYICLPIARSSSTRLTADGKKLIDAAINYLLNDEPSVEVPTLMITNFVIDGVNGIINQSEKTIKFDIDLSLHPDLDMKAVTPVISVASGYTITTPGTGEAVDLSENSLIPFDYVVTDYISRVVYSVYVHTYYSHGIENVYTAGEWVNIYDIYGRKVATTNENIYTMTLPHGVYVAVTETGETIKITR